MSAPGLTPEIGSRQWKSGISAQMSSFSDDDELWFMTGWPRPAAASWKTNASSGATRRLCGDGSYSIGIRSRSFWFVMEYGMYSEPEMRTRSAPLSSTLYLSCSMTSSVSTSSPMSPTMMTSNWRQSLSCIGHPPASDCPNGRDALAYSRSFGWMP